MIMLVIHSLHNLLHYEYIPQPSDKISDLFIPDSSKILFTVTVIYIFLNIYLYSSYKYILHTHIYVYISYIQIYMMAWIYISDTTLYRL